MATGMGRLLGPSLGALLAEPAKEFPALFDHPFWIRFPYLLPCALGAAVCLATFLLAAFYLNGAMLASVFSTRLP